MVGPRCRMDPALWGDRSRDGRLRTTDRGTRHIRRSGVERREVMPVVQAERVGPPSARARAGRSQPEVPTSSRRHGRLHGSIPAAGRVRRCGATYDISDANDRATGLSPRMRGYLPLGERVDVLGGSIPADAGLPYGRTEIGRHEEVYPRGCGATSSGGRRLCTPSGLSPRMRGYLLEPVGHRMVGGSIPADAGLPPFI